MAMTQSRHHQSLYWLRCQNTLIFSPRIHWTNEIDNRRFFSPDVQNQLIMHSRVHLKKNRWDFAGGLTYSLAYAAIPANGFRSTAHEVRPVVEGSFELPVKRWYMQHRVRIDNRFLQTDPESSVFSASDYIARLRYRVQFRVPLKIDDVGHTTVSLRIGDEIMLNHMGHYYDQNRIYANLEYVLNRHLAVEGGYLFIDQRRLGRDEYFSRHVIRFSLLHRVSLQGSKD